MQLTCTLLRRGWIKLDLQVVGENEFLRVLNIIKNRLNVITYDRSFKRYLTSIYEFDNLKEICDQNNIELYVSAKLLRYIKRNKIKKKFLNNIKGKELNIKKWVDDKDSQLLPYQKEGVLTGLYHKRFLIGDEMGVGKTPEAIGIILKAFEFYGHKNALVVCPNRIKKQWLGELEKFTTLSNRKFAILGERHCYTGAVKHFIKNRNICKECKFYKRCSKLKELEVNQLRKLQMDNAEILITNYEMIRVLKSEFLKKEYDVIILDEATKLKNRNAQITKLMKKFVDNQPTSTLVIAMSGTFLENRLEELYSIMNIIDDKILGTFQNFKERYLVLDYWNNVIGYRNKKELRIKLHSILIRRTIEEVWHDRPKIIENIIECKMDDFQCVIYNHARDGVLAEIKDLRKANKINMANIGALLSYLLMIADTVKAIDPKCSDRNHSSKLKMLNELLEEEIPLKSKVLIFSRFANKVIPHIIEDLGMRSTNGKGILKITGKTKNSADVIKDFTENNYKFLVCSDAMAYGINLQIADFVVNFDLPWNPAVIEQRIRRVYRKGRTKPVRVLNLIVPDTVEEKLFQTIALKRQLFNEFFNDNYEYKKLNVSDMLKLI